MHVLHEKLFNAMSNPRFLSGEAAGAETPFYICPYDVAKSAEMEESIQLLSKRLEDNGIHTLSIDLFALMVDTMKENDDFDWTIEHEDGQTCEELREDLHGILEEQAVSRNWHIVSQTTQAIQLIVTNRILYGCYVYITTEGVVF